jgi:hypothetical protein
MTAPTREEFSGRLLRGSVKKYYEPVVDIDWESELDPDKFFLPPKVVSLYGTPIWDAMTREQQIELSRQELVNTLSAGIWFENILNQAILRKIMHEDPTGNETHYALTEMGDETRHMVMFGKAISRLGAKPIQPRWWQRVVINALPLGFKGSVLWVAALIGEEIFDSLQRQMMDDPELQPMVQRLMRIHVTEEARHIQFARDLGEVFDGTVVGDASGEPQMPRILLDAEVRRLEQFLYQDDLRAFAGCLPDELFGCCNIGVDIPAAGELQGCDADLALCDVQMRG